MWLWSVAFAITNGEPVPPGGAPAVVALDPGSTGGFLIHPQVVLTTAHAFDGVDLAQEPEGDAEVFFGDARGQGGLRVPVASVVVHPAYVSIGFSPNAVSSGPVPENDVALAFLAEPVDVPVIALNEAPLDDAWIGMSLEIAGFGAPASGAAPTGAKHRGDTRIASYEADVVMLFDAEGAATCIGDAGTPGVRFVADQPVAVSLTSIGGCGERPERHMRIDRYLDWIRDEVGDAGLIVRSVAPLGIVCSSLIDGGDAHAVLPVGTELLCEAFGVGTIEEVAWDWGDGTEESTTGARGGHAYAEPGSFDVSACIATGQTHCVAPVRVDACALPRPAFEALPDGDAIVVTYTATPQPEACILESVWELYAGDGAQGEPLRSTSGEAPVFDVSGEPAGDYTVVLNEHGIVGDGAATATVQVRRGCACSASSTRGGLLAVLLAMLGLRRRG
ncbi:MAG: trypsin-like serine protease [Alphaproteobacteria bacterium]|nr:trypsin-like serine protease [Alphaproteobacteria bacterium]